MPAFVIQLHDARRLHYDVRLEVDGVLKSWAVPRGPSLDPVVKRLAVPTDDHAMEYASYEGVHAGARYGSGAVIIWDAGNYQNQTRDKERKLVEPAVAIERGHFRFALQGVKLTGRGRSRGPVAMGTGCSSRFVTMLLIRWLM